MSYIIKGIVLFG